MLIVDATRRRGRAAARGLRRGVPLAADVHRRDALLPCAGGAPDLACTSPGCALRAPAALRISVTGAGRGAWIELERRGQGAVAWRAVCDGPVPS